MLTELIKHKNLGEINNILFVLQDVIAKEPVKSMSIADIKKYCSDKTLDLSYEVDGILALLEFVEIISRSRSRNSVKLKKDISAPWIKGMEKTLLARTIIEKVLIKLKEESCLENFISLDKVRFDTTLNQISISNNSIPIRYSSIKNLLINLGGLRTNPEYPSILLIDESLQEHFEKQVVPWLVDERERLVFSKGDSAFSLEKLLELQELKNQYGAQAEEYVLEFEKKRLTGHPLPHEIRRISNFDVSAGYDIVSFDHQGSLTFDRLIEVKSYSKYPEFYWSKNEVRVAEIKQKNYCLYLVDREQIGTINYQPMIIPDPFNSVFGNPKWQKEPQSWFIKPDYSFREEEPTQAEIKVFISYSHEDKPFANRLAEDLAAKGCKVWWDYSIIKGGQDWQREIENGIDDCHCFVVVLTSDSVGSEWVRNEIALAQHKNKTIIPLRLSNCEIPISIIQKQYIEFDTQTHEAALKELLDIVQIQSKNLSRI